MEKVLIIDDNADFARDLELMLNDSFIIMKAETSANGLEMLRSRQYSLVLLDLQLPDIPGLEVLEMIHAEIDPYLPVIIITEYDDAQYVVKAMRLGAYDFLSKDFHVELMKEKMHQALRQKELKLKVSGIQDENVLTKDSFIFASEQMKKINFEITKLANLDFDVLLTGETGVGKDMVASQIHMRGKRKDKPFLPVPIRSLSETVLESELFGHEKGSFTGADRLKVGKFESANHGIVYLPEISNLPENIQLKLLHFMQYKKISRIGQDSRKGEMSLDVRLISATNESLDDILKYAKIREDFYYRLTGITLTIPPLRERTDDILPLANYFLNKYSSHFGKSVYKFSDEALDGFIGYEWRGNVRELSNSIKNALSYTDGSVLELKHFPNILRYKSGSLMPNLSAEKEGELLPYRDFENKYKTFYFKSLLDRCNGKVSTAAELAGLTPQGFRKILKQLNLEY